MRGFLLGCLTTATAGGVYLIFAGPPAPGHCGPCAAPPKEATGCESGVCPVTDVVDVKAELTRPAVPGVSFDEPPLAKPADGRVVQSGFTAPAPRPPRPLPIAPTGPIPLQKPTDPF